MSGSAFGDLAQRVSKLEERGGPETYPAYIAGRDKVIGQALDRTGRATLALPVGTILAGENVLAVGSYTWGSYLTGGVTLTGKPSAPSETAVLMEPFVDPATAVYFPVWDSGAQKMVVYDNAGAQVPNATDLSGAGASKYMVLGSRRADRVFWQSNGAAKVTGVRAVIGGSFTANPTNYWTLTVTRRRVAISQTIGDVLGEAYSLADRSLASQVPVTLYDAPLGTDVADGDTLVLYANGTGTPAPLDDLVLLVDIQRIVR